MVLPAVVAVMSAPADRIKRLHRLELENFKSYKGKQTIGTLSWHVGATLPEKNTNPNPFHAVSLTLPPTPWMGVLSLFNPETLVMRLVGHILLFFIARSRSFAQSFPSLVPSWSPR